MANNKWMTTFVYQQELKSYYMNNLLYSVVRPGVYNAGIELKIEENNKLKLTLQKGTTLVFSNDYVGAPDLGSDKQCYRRSFNTRNFVYKSDLKTDSVYLIKCTALVDEEYELSLPLPEDQDKFYYITSYFKYDPNISNEATPSFKLFYNGGNNSGDAYFVSGVNGGVTLVEGMGDSSEDVKNSINRSFLHLGAVKFNNGNIEAFTSRGLPEHRYGMVSDRVSMNPDIIYDINGGIGNTIYVDLRDILHKGGIYSIDTDWEKLYGIRGYNNASSKSIDLRDLNLDSELNYIPAADVVFAVLPTIKNVDSLSKKESIKLVSYSIDLEDSFLESNTSGMLDTSIENVERLITFAKGYNFIPYAIKMLMNNGEITPETGDSVIPICIAFRNENRINPANVLSLMDLEYKACKVNTLSLDQDAYSIIPVIV